MSKQELCSVLLKWLQTFQVKGSCDSVNDIMDGVVMAQALHQIAPEWFSNTWLSKIKTDVGDNWRLKVSNLKKIVEGICDYYQEFVSSSIDFVRPDALRIGEHNDLSELVKLLQLILGCAVNCNRKQEYIKQIMMMEESAQSLIMQSIQELENLLGSTQMSFSSSLSIGAESQYDQLVSELHMTAESRDQIAQRCVDLEIQVNTLKDEKHNLEDEKKKLEERLQEILDDPVKENVFRKQIDMLKEEIFKLETSRDDYRMKLDIHEADMVELQRKFDLLQQTAVEAYRLKDEVDILRENADKVEKLESTVQHYKKKLEELSELKREMKLLESKNLTYIQQTLELEEELKKANVWKTQVDMYKKQVNELRINLTEETRKVDKMEFENAKAHEKLSALQKEKERLIVERDSLKESNEELLCNKLQLTNDDSSNISIVEGKNDTISERIMSVAEMKRELVRLQHENTLLKINQKQSEGEKLPLLQEIIDDLTQQNKQLQTDYRQANHRILQLEAELKEKNENIDKDSSSVNKDLQNQLQLEKKIRLSESAEKDRLLLEMKHVKSVLVDSLSRKEFECEEWEDKYKRCIEKARLIAKSLDFPELISFSEDMVDHIRCKPAEKERNLDGVAKQIKQSKVVMDTEEKLMASAFYNFAQKKQQESIDQRLMGNSTVASNLSFLARQRQSAITRSQIPYNSK